MFSKQWWTVWTQCSTWFIVYLGDTAEINSHWICSIFADNVGIVCCCWMRNVRTETTVEWIILSKYSPGVSGDLFLKSSKILKHRCIQCTGLNKWKGRKWALAHTVFILTETYLRIIHFLIVKHAFFLFVERYVGHQWIAKVKAVKSCSSLNNSE